LIAAGLPEGRIARVVGKADREPLDPDHPEAAKNRRISIVLLRSTPP
jgi:chemotaxis protein MotB